MIGKTIVLLLISLFILSNSAFATGWVYLQRQEGTRWGPCTEYVNIDSVVKNEDKVVYWTIYVLDEVLQYDGTKKILFKKEAPLVYPLQYRTLEQYYYNSEGLEIRNYTNQGKYYYEEPEEIGRVLEYAKSGQDRVAKPDHTVTPNPRWCGFVELEDCVVYWNVNATVAWPQANPTTVEMTVKYLWNKAGIEKRITYLKAQKWYHAGVDGLNYTLVNYQLLLTENRVRILSEADHNIANRRMTLLEGSGWYDIAKGSKEEQVRRIALNWLNGKEDYGKYVKDDAIEGVQ